MVTASVLRVDDISYSNENATVCNQSVFSSLVSVYADKRVFRFTYSALLLLTSRRERKSTVMMNLLKKFVSDWWSYPG